MTAFNCIVVTERFPNVYHTYILNILEHVAKHGGEIAIVSGKPLGLRIDERVHRYRLLDRSYSYSFDSTSDALKVAWTYFNPFTSRGRCSFRGIKRQVSSPDWSAVDLRTKVKRVAKSAILGTDIDFHLIHAHYMKGAYDSLHIAQILGVPMVVSFHGLQSIDPQRPFPLTRREADSVFERSRVFTTGTFYAKQILVDFGCPADKIEVMPLGTKLSDFPFSPRPYSADRPIVCLTVARLSLEKGHKYAIEAMKTLRARGWNVVYRVVGHGPWRAQLEQLVKDLHAEDYVSLVGEKSGPDLVAEYLAADLFVLPSIQVPHHRYAEETQGVVMQEAQACGKIVVATRTGGIPECLDDRSGFLVPQADSEALADEVEWILQRPERWPDWQRAGRAWVESRFSMEVAGRQLSTIYQRATGQALHSS